MKFLKKALAITVSLALCGSLIAPALAVEYDIANGDVSIGQDDSGVWSQQGGGEMSNDTEITITGSSTENTVTVGSNVTDATITLDGVDISSDKDAAISIGAGSDVTIELDGENKLQGGTGHAGLELNNKGDNGKPAKDTPGGSVTIKDENGTSGSLTATGGNSAAGIGSGSRGEAGDITIDGADVTATGGGSAAGIGSGNYGEAGDITISGGADVTATGGSSSAGIGSGSYGEVGDITITDSDIDSTGGTFAAGIGASSSSSVAGDITITGSTVDATGGYNGAGIGTGFNGTAGDINITDSDVTAAGGREGAGIGSGRGGKVQDITITGGNIVAKAGTAGGLETYGIGGYKCGAVTLKDLESLLALGKGTYGVKETAASSQGQGILNGKFGGNLLEGAKEATITIYDADGQVVGTVEMGPEEGGMWSGLAVLMPEGKYYVHVSTDANPQGGFAAQAYTMGSIAYPVKDGKVLSKTFADCAQYTVNYGFTSTDPELALPDDMPALPESVKQKLTVEAFQNGVTCDAAYEDIEVEGGRWHFTGWTTAPVLNPKTGNLATVQVNGNSKYMLTVVGSWEFVADEPEPVPTPTPVPGGDTGDTGGTDITIEDEAVPLAAGPVTRAQFVDYLWRHESQPEADAPTFDDVPADHEFAPAIGWAQANGLVDGDENGLFHPDELVTVAAVRAILARFAERAGMAMPQLTTLTGGEGEAVLNCDQVLAEFFGEEYEAPDTDDLEIDTAA
ncbi:MAG: hypothetical protein HFF20_03075 [Oscillospiraceae bacterium]|nr:hypothetical protein [Oscillospiraceae bacterium]MCI9548197.1 hypothetical protein [Oscillospiraceae bacterium]